MQIHKIKQKSDEWFELKKQYPFSASKAQAIANAGAGLETLVDEAIIGIHSTGQKEIYTNGHLERGNELEEQARSIYELEKGVTVEEVGFVTEEEYSYAGVSPDGLVNEDGLTEIKCLADNVYLKKLYAIAETNDFKVDTGHEWQMQMQMLFTKRKWCDYVLYNPNFKKSILIKRVMADPVKQEKIKTGLKLAELQFNKKKELLTKLK
jgi:hypothetical protein